MPRRPFATALAAIALAAPVGACMSMADEPPKAPQPAKAIDAARFYTGTWHEIARNEMKLTDGCVAGITLFTRDGSGRLIDRDSCRMGDPNTGKEKVFAGPATIDDIATNAKFTTAYRVFGVFSVKRTYWILDHDDAYSWFIVATPSFADLSVFARDPQVSTTERDRLVARARALGYDTSKLEYPVQPSR